MITLGYTTVGSVADVQYGASLPDRVRNSAGSINVYGSNGVVGRHDQPLTAGPFLVVGRKGSIGAVNFSHDAGWPIDTTFWLKPKDSQQTNIRYLYWVLKSTNLVRTAQLTAVPGLSRLDLEAARVPVLSPERQLEVANLLDLADGIRRKRREALRLADELVRATFLEMFGDPVGNPRGWEIGRLGDLAKFKSGSFLPASAMAPDGTFAVYGGNGVNGRHDEFLFPDPMIVVGRVGAYCGAVHRTEPCSWVTDNALFAEWIAPVLREDYFEWFLRFFNLNKLADRAGQPLISNGRLAPVLVPLPPVHVQEAFGRRLQSMGLAIGKLNLALQKAETLFTSLQNQAFGGTE